MSGVYTKNGYTTDRLTEWLFACMMIGWGLWLLVPEWETFQSPQYVLLRSLASEPVWGVWSVAIGVIRVSALYINGAHRRTPLVRAICAGFGVVWWMVLSFLFFSTPSFSNPPAAYAWYPIFIVFEFICVARSAKDGWHTRAYSSRRSPYR
jgi:hypothetical protein